MPIRDQAAQEASLNNDYGATHGAHAPAAFEVALFDADPTLGGVELVGNGYARGAITNGAAFPPAADGVKRSAAPVAFPTATGAWETARYWALFDPVAGVWWDYAPLVEPLDVTAAGPGPTVALAIFYTNNPS